MVKLTQEKPVHKASSSDTAPLGDASNDAHKKTASRNLLRPSLNGAVTIEQFSKQFGAIDLRHLMDSLTEQSKTVSNGDLSRAEGMLITQAHTLDAIFNNLAQKASRADCMDKLDRSLRLALKAQSQCRATLQTLGELKNPQPIAFVKQANISNGPQQVNNGESFATNTRARARKTQKQPNELLEAKPYEQVDTRAPSTASQFDSAMETMGKIDRAADTRR